MRTAFHDLSLLSVSVYIYKRVSPRSVIELNAQGTCVGSTTMSLTDIDFGKQLVITWKKAKRIDYVDAITFCPLLRSQICR